MTLDNLNISFLKVQPAVLDFVDWALSALIWGNILTLLAQVDIPSEVWGQYPLILLGVVLVGWLARYWVANEREWRSFTTQQVTDKEAANLAILKLVQDGYREQIASIEANHQKQLDALAESLAQTYEAGLERILEQQAQEAPRVNSGPKRAAGAFK